MTQVKTHYESLLGPVYAWSVSGGGDPFERAGAWLVARQGMDADTYLDLGAGFGAHVVPLARAGKQVTAVDFDTLLLEQLAAHVKDAPRPVAIHQTDLVGFVAAAESRWDVVLCAGDTLAHLQSLDAAAGLVSGCARRLTPGGRLALSFRNTSVLDLSGTDRFIPVKRDATRTMHCLLEVMDQDRLRVTDIVTDVTPEGPVTRIGDYIKLMLSPARVERWAQNAGLRLERQDVEGGMVSQIFRRPA